MSKKRKFKVGDKVILKGWNEVTTILNINEEKGYYDCGRYIGDSVLMFESEDKFTLYTEEDAFKEEINEELRYIEAHLGTIKELFRNFYGKERA